MSTTPQTRLIMKDATAALGGSYRGLKSIPATKKRPRAEDAKYESMYRAYLGGMSTDRIARELYKGRIHPETIRCAFRLRGWPMRLQRKNELVEYAGLSFWPDKGAGDRLRTNGGGYRGKYLHHLVWERSHGPIPAGHVIHHKDGNVKNNTIENLECLTVGEANRRYNPHRNQRTPADQVNPLRSVRFGTRKSNSKKPAWLS